MDTFFIGSHNSGTYHVSNAISSSMYSQGSPFAQKVACIHSFFPCVKRFVQTQKYSIYDQLRIGVRFLDIRVALFPNSELFVTHTIACVPFTTVISDISRFLTENSTELFVLLIRPDWELYNYSPTHAELMEVLTPIQEHCFFGDFSTLTKADLISMGKNIIVRSTIDERVQTNWLNEPVISELVKRTQYLTDNAPVLNTGALVGISFFTTMVVGGWNESWSGFRNGLKTAISSVASEAQETNRRLSDLVIDTTKFNFILLDYIDETIVGELQSKILK
jgi:hypothetical protein